MRMITRSPEVESACETQFENAKRRAAGYMYAVDLDDYDFHHTCGGEVLRGHDIPGAEPLVL